MSTPTNNQTGILLLGNSGVGKSFLANVCLRRSQFVHEESITSVTTSTDFSDQEQFKIFNIPGLIESEQSHIERNKREIEKAFQECPNSRIVFVCAGSVGGRLQDQDVVAYKALSKAYRFNPRSVVFVMNRLAKKTAKSTKYRIEAIDMMRKMFELPSTVTQQQFVFTSQIDDDIIDDHDSVEHRTIFADLMLAFATTEPTVHRRSEEIRLQADEIVSLKNEAAEQQNKFKQWQEENKAEMDKMAKEYETKMKELYKKLEEAKKKRGFFAMVGQAMDKLFGI